MAAVPSLEALPLITTPPALIMVRTRSVWASRTCRCAGPSSEAVGHTSSDVHAYTWLVGGGCWLCTQHRQPTPDTRRPQCAPGGDGSTSNTAPLLGLSRVQMQCTARSWREATHSVLCIRLSVHDVYLPTLSPAPDLQEHTQGAMRQEPSALALACTQGGHAPAGRLPGSRSPTHSDLKTHASY